MDHTRKLADFCSRLSFDDLPQAVVEKTKLCLLDYIANIYGSLELDAVQNAIAAIRKMGPGGDIAALGCGFATHLQSAALINGITAEAIEAQDGTRFGGNHPGVAVLPATLGVGQQAGCNGRAIIEAIALGYEATNRPAMAMHPWHTLSGFLPTGTCGTFGAAAAAAKLMGLDEAGMLNALSNAGYLLPLSMAEQLMGGHTIKIAQGGQAASAGIMAATLAAAGIGGSPVALEGSALKAGFTQITTSAEPAFDKMSEGLGDDYSIMDIYFKPYTACRHTHGAAQASIELARENQLAIDAIEKVVVHTYGIAELAVGKGYTTGDSFVSAQFSIPFVVAVCLTDGELGPAQLTEARLADPALAALSKKVTIKTDEALNAGYPEKTASRIEIHLTDGRMHERQVDRPKGDPRDPMTREDIAAKVRKFAGDRDAGRVDKLITTVLQLEELPAIQDLVELM